MKTLGQYWKGGVMGKGKGREQIARANGRLQKEVKRSKKGRSDNV